MVQNLSFALHVCRSVVYLELRCYWRWSSWFTGRSWWRSAWRVWLQWCWGTCPQIQPGTLFCLFMLQFH